MMTIPKHSSVLIVGAGPSGLMMAAQLLRHGVTPVIIDSKQGPTDRSKALAVQARSLEIYRQMGLIDRVLAGGTPAGGAALHVDGEQVASLPLSEAGRGKTRFPYVYMYPQSHNERTLLDHLTTNCLPVYWDVVVNNIVHTSTGAEITLTQNGESSTITTDWLIGADGAHSIVRKSAGISFHGDTYAHRFYLADIKLKEGFSDDLVHLFMSRKGFAGFFLMPQRNEYRVVGSLPPELDDEDISFEDVLPSLRDMARQPLDVSEVVWFTRYKLHHRMADRFRQGRCFLIGDAAHIHSPVGGQGMNTGLQDAYNLAWKLAGVVKKQYGPAILNTYADERKPVAEELLNTTDRIFNVVTSQTWFSNALKKYIVPLGIKVVRNSPKLLNAAFRQVSQIGITYRQSKLNLTLGHAHQLKAGDRLPYVIIYDEKRQEDTDIHAWCSKPGFTLITMGLIQEGYLFTLAKWITQRYNGTLNFYHLPPSEKNRSVMETFEVADGQRKAIIVRPDMYIGYINDTVSIEMMDNYLRDVVGFII